MTDIEIARNTKLDNIVDVAKKVDVKEEDLELYGKYKAKFSSELYEKVKDRKNGKLILVTAISPTPLGEGKTTMSIAIADGLRKINKKSILALREPSLGPVFGIKGGATGGGRVQVAPMEDINLHFTGDIHAITAANNLLASLIDNHIYFGNELVFEIVVIVLCFVNTKEEKTIQLRSSFFGTSISFLLEVAFVILMLWCLYTNNIFGSGLEQKDVFAFVSMMIVSSIGSLASIFAYFYYLLH